MKYISSCSFGKDSLSTVLIAIEHDEPIDEAVCCEVMFDEHISGEVPEHREFIYEQAKPYLEQHGIKVTIIRGERTFVSEFFHVVGKGKCAGKIWGWPLCSRCCIQRDCKSRPLDRYRRTLPADTIQYLGFATDEQDRLLRLGENKISLLEKYGIAEKDTFQICKRHGLLSPIYEFANRNGCFFCPNAKERELRHLYDYHPDLWARFLELQQAKNKCTELFNRDFRFDEIDAIFRLDDAQYSLFDKHKGDSA
ncbi:phosphoadenosine phosphosulfate reductase [Intestinimonas butyriciproducens]|uniref:phosphoadenosine phosphosulfate reductase n=1 Tax=Intestinimonas butyriciproducens TaxID=1297617 RepID=UPI00189E7095|nr:phosphoadenosine phosphosulfate reductase [Intestinimonas butyriciproducens]